MDGAPGKLAMTDLAATGEADPAGLAHREGREIVVKQEGFLVSPFERIDILLVVAGAERGHHQSLSLAAGEQCRAMGAGEDADLADDRADVGEAAAVDAGPGLDDVAADDLLLDLLESASDLLGLDLGAFRGEALKHALLDLADPEVTLLLAGNAVGTAQSFAGALTDAGENVVTVVGHELARRAGGPLGQADDGVEHRLEAPVAEHHGAEHHLLGELEIGRAHV